MKRLKNRGATAAGLLSCVLTVSAGAAEAPKIVNPKFTGSQSCASTSCHGGGKTHNEAIIYGRQDRHSRAQAILNKGTSRLIAEALGIGRPAQAVQCNVCHAPMHTVPPERLMKDLAPDNAVGCEACHGAAEPWLRFHTRADATFEQMVETGLRNLVDLYGRANTCVACHQNLDPAIVDAGHPELFFELDAQTQPRPPHYMPHYVDARPSIGPRSWLTGQAAALREVSWKLADQRDDKLAVRWKALQWLLRMTEPGRKLLPEGENFAATKSAADELARAAAKAIWSDTEVEKLLGTYLATEADFRAGKLDKVEFQRRAEVLAPAIHSLWRARKKKNSADLSVVEAPMQKMLNLANDGKSFDAETFANALKELRVAISGE